MAMSSADVLLLAALDSHLPLGQVSDLRKRTPYLAARLLDRRMDGASMEDKALYAGVTPRSVYNYECERPPRHPLAIAEGRNLHARIVQTLQVCDWPMDLGDIADALDDEPPDRVQRAADQLVARGVLQETQDGYRVTCKGVYRAPSAGLVEDAVDVTLTHGRNLDRQFAWGEDDLRADLAVFTFARPATLEGRRLFRARVRALLVELEAEALDAGGPLEQVEVAMSWSVMDGTTREVA